MTHLFVLLHFFNAYEIKLVEVGRLISYLYFPSSQGSDSVHCNNSSVTLPCTTVCLVIFLISSDCSPAPHIQYFCLFDVAQSHESYQHTWGINFHASSCDHIKLSIYVPVLMSLLSSSFTISVL